jgi:hypothetical protein
LITIHTLVYNLPHKYYIIINNTIKTTNLIFIGFPIFHIQWFILILLILKFIYCMKINLNYMSILYRTLNCTLVNVVQSEPKLFRKIFHICLLWIHLCTNCPCKVTHKRPRKSVVFLTGQLIPTNETIKQHTSTSSLITTNFSFFSFIHSGDGFMEIILCIS